MSFLREKIEIGIEEAELATQNTFFGFSRKVKWYLAVIALGIIPIYFIAKMAGEKIWLQAHKESNIEAKTSFSNPKSPKVSEVNVIKTGQSNYAAVVQVSNQNLDLSLKEVSYKFNFYNSGKQKIYESPGTLFLLPDQAKYLTVPRFTAQEPVAYAELELPKDLLWQKRLEIPEVGFIISKANAFLQSSPPAFAAEGYFINNSSYVLRQVRLTFLLRDFANKIVGVSQRDEFTVKPMERRAYKQLWPDLEGFNISRVEVFADTNVLDPGNLSAGD